MQLHFKLKTCYNPCDIHYSGKGYEITWSIYANCNKFYHKTAKCQILLEKQKLANLDIVPWDLLQLIKNLLGNQ